MCNKLTIDYCNEYGFNNAYHEDDSGFGDIPILTDDNYPGGANIWLVLDSDYDQSTGKMIGLLWVLEKRNCPILFLISSFPLRFNTDNLRIWNWIFT